MSLILEALKKSEDKRRLGAAPDLATPFSAPRRRNWVWPIAAVVVAVGLIAWALRPSSPPPQTPAVVAAPSKNGATNLRAVVTPGQKSGAPLRSVTGANDQTPTAPPDNLPKPAPPSGPPPAGKFAVGQPGPNGAMVPLTENHHAVMESARERRRAAQGGDRPGSEGPPPSVGLAAKMPPPPPPQKANALAAQPAAPSAPVASAPVPPPAAPLTPPPTAQPMSSTITTPKVDAMATVAEPSRATKSSSTVGLTPTPATPAAPAEKTTTTASSAQPYAELPFSVRKSLPELKLSMHVYAADAPHRFVVLNDSRLTEGEKTTDEIFVREIRPDGVVLEFQNQRFFYPRDGL